MKTLFASVAMTALFIGGASVAQAEHHAEMAEKQDIVDTAASNENFSTLVAAVKAAGLVEALNPADSIVEAGEVICANEPIYESFAKVIRK